MDKRADHPNDCPPLGVLILSYGSRGDVQLYVALGLGLQARGHRVTLACPARFRAFVEHHGLSFAPLSDDMLNLLETDEGHAFLEAANSPAQFLAYLPRLAARLGPLQDALLADSWKIAQNCQPDVIVYHPKTYGGPDIAERLGVPAILSLPVPYIVPTGELPNTVFPELSLPRGLEAVRETYNLITYRSVAALLGLATAPYRSGLRQKIGLPRAPVTEAVKFTPRPEIAMLHAISEHVVPRPADWPENAWMTGYWFLDEAPGWTPPPALSAFLDAGPPPVYVGFGSMSGRDPRRMGRAVISALAKTGQRAVIASGWGGVALSETPANVHLLEAAPHDWLFPRMSAVVHHGGAGTTAAGLRAGKPTLVVPFFGDQPFWGKRVEALGAGPAPLMARDLTDEMLARKLARLTGTPAYLAAAETIGAKLRAEDGVANAVRRIETYTAAAQSRLRT